MVFQNQLAALGSITGFVFSTVIFSVFNDGDLANSYLVDVEESTA